LTVFEVVLEFQDPYVNSEPHREGYAFVYLSEKFYKDVEAICERILAKSLGGIIHEQPLGEKKEIHRKTKEEFE